MNKQVRCKNCRNKFNGYSSLDPWCKELDCQVAKGLHLLSKDKKQKAKEWRVEKKAIKEKLKTKSDYLKELQVVFNTYIRARDQGLNCISCQKPAKKENAGHYASVGASPQLRFDEFNCHLQCEYCNTYLHANLINYRIHLIEKIGIEEVERLESDKEPKHYSIPDLIEMKVIYKDKVKELKR